MLGRDGGYVPPRVDPKLYAVILGERRDTAPDATFKQLYERIYQSLLQYYYLSAK